MIRRNNSGSVTVLDHKYKVTISARTVAFEEMWANLGPNPKSWVPKPFECFSCRSIAMYRVSSRQMGPETVLIRFKCGNCREEDTDVLD